MLIHKVLPLVNPSFDEWDFVTNRPTGWTITSDSSGGVWTDQEKYTRVSSVSLKVTTGSTAGARTVLSQEVLVSPGLEYGLKGWVCIFEVPNNNIETPKRMKVGWALTEDLSLGIRDLSVNWIDAKNRDWVFFGVPPFTPTQNKVKFCIVQDDFFVGINVAYWDHFDDPQW